jgi:hypothetical protein
MSRIRWRLSRVAWSWHCFQRLPTTGITSVASAMKTRQDQHQLEQRQPAPPRPNGSIEPTELAKRRISRPPASGTLPRLRHGGTGTRPRRRLDPRPRASTGRPAYRSGRSVRPRPARVHAGDWMRRISPVIVAGIQGPRVLGRQLQHNRTAPGVQTAGSPVQSVQVGKSRSPPSASVTA